MTVERRALPTAGKAGVKQATEPRRSLGRASVVPNTRRPAIYSDSGGAGALGLCAR
jgi:hypothetical protein